MIPRFVSIAVALCWRWRWYISQACRRSCWMAAALKPACAKESMSISSKGTNWELPRGFWSLYLDQCSIWLLPKLM